MNVIVKLYAACFLTILEGLFCDLNFHQLFLQINPYGGSMLVKWLSEDNFGKLNIALHNITYIKPSYDLNNIESINKSILVDANFYPLPNILLNGYNNNLIMCPIQAHINPILKLLFFNELTVIPCSPPIVLHSKLLYYELLYSFEVSLLPKGNFSNFILNITDWMNDLKHLKTLKIEIFKFEQTDNKIIVPTITSSYLHKHLSFILNLTLLNEVNKNIQEPNQIVWLNFKNNFQYNLSDKLLYNGAKYQLSIYPCYKRVCLQESIAPALSEKSSKISYEYTNSLYVFRLEPLQPNITTTVITSVTKKTPADTFTADGIAAYEEKVSVKIDWEIAGRTIFDAFIIDRLNISSYPLGPPLITGPNLRSYTFDFNPLHKELFQIRCISGFWTKSLTTYSQPSIVTIYHESNRQLNQTATKKEEKLLLSGPGNREIMILNLTCHSFIIDWKSRDEENDGSKPFSILYFLNVSSPGGNVIETHFFKELESEFSLKNLQPCTMFNVALEIYENGSLTTTLHKNVITPPPDLLNFTIQNRELVKDPLTDHETFTIYLIWNNHLPASCTNKTITKLLIEAPNNWSNILFSQQFQENVSETKLIFQNHSPNQKRQLQNSSSKTILRTIHEPLSKFYGCLILLKLFRIIFDPKIDSEFNNTTNSQILTLIVPRTPNIIYSYQSSPISYKFKFNSPTTHESFCNHDVNEHQRYMIKQFTKFECFQGPTHHKKVILNETFPLNVVGDMNCLIDIGNNREDDRTLFYPGNTYTCLLINSITFNNNFTTLSTESLPVHITFTIAPIPLTINKIGTLNEPEDYLIPNLLSPLNFMHCNKSTTYSIACLNGQRDFNYDNQSSLSNSISNEILRDISIPNFNNNYDFRNNNLNKIPITLLGYSLNNYGNEEHNNSGYPSTTCNSSSSSSSNTLKYFNLCRKIISNLNNNNYSSNYLMNIKLNYNFNLNNINKDNISHPVNGILKNFPAKLSSKNYKMDGFILIKYTFLNLSSSSYYIKTQIFKYQKKVIYNGNSSTPFEYVVIINHLIPGFRYKFKVYSYASDTTNILSQTNIYNFSIAPICSAQFELTIESFNTDWAEFTWNEQSLDHIEGYFEYFILQLNIVQHISQNYTIPNTETTSTIYRIQRNFLADNTSFLSHFIFDDHYYATSQKTVAEETADENQSSGFEKSSTRLSFKATSLVPGASYTIQLKVESAGLISREPCHESTLHLRPNAVDATQVKVIPQEKSLHVKWYGPIGSLYEYFVVYVKPSSPLLPLYYGEFNETAVSIAAVPGRKSMMYTVYSSKTTDPSATTYYEIRAKNLLPFTEYVIEIVTVSSGVGLMSQALVVRARTLDSIPGPVQNFRLYDIRPNALTLRWNEPSPVGGNIIGYRIKISQMAPSSKTSNSISYRFTSSKMNSLHISSTAFDGESQLRAGKTYVLDIQAESGKGEGPFLEEPLFVQLPIWAPPEPSNSATPEIIHDLYHLLTFLQSNLLENSTVFRVWQNYLKPYICTSPSPTSVTVTDVTAAVATDVNGTGVVSDILSNKIQSLMEFLNSSVNYVDVINEFHREDLNFICSPRVINTFFTTENGFTLQIFEKIKFYRPFTGRNGLVVAVKTPLKSLFSDENGEITELILVLRLNLTRRGGNTLFSPSSPYLRPNGGKNDPKLLNETEFKDIFTELQVEDIPIRTGLTLNLRLFDLTPWLFRRKPLNVLDENSLEFSEIMRLKAQNTTEFTNFRAFWWQSYQLTDSRLRIPKNSWLVMIFPDSTSTTSTFTCDEVTKKCLKFNDGNVLNYPFNWIFNKSTQTMEELLLSLEVNLRAYTGENLFTDSRYSTQSNPIKYSSKDYHFPHHNHFMRGTFQEQQHFFHPPNNNNSKIQILTNKIVLNGKNSSSPLIVRALQEDFKLPLLIGSRTTTKSATSAVASIADYSSKTILTLIICILFVSTMFVLFIYVYGYKRNLFFQIYTTSILNPNNKKRYNKKNNNTKNKNENNYPSYSENKFGLVSSIFSRHNKNFGGGDDGRINNCFNDKDINSRQQIVSNLKSYYNLENPVFDDIQDYNNNHQLLRRPSENLIEMNNFIKKDKLLNINHQQMTQDKFVVYNQDAADDDDHHLKTAATGNSSSIKFTLQSLGRKISMKSQKKNTINKCNTAYNFDNYYMDSNTKTSFDIYKNKRKPVCLVPPIKTISSNGNINVLKTTREPIKICEFSKKVKELSADGDIGFAEEFEELKYVGKGQSCVAALLKPNIEKNRFTNILPYDHSRVKLLPFLQDVIKEEEEDVSSYHVSSKRNTFDNDLECLVNCSDYINSNYIPGLSSKDEYIATQGPLPRTVNDFWRMIWEQNCRVIVMLTRLNEMGKDKCARYWPMQINVDDNNVHDDGNCNNANQQQYGDINLKLCRETHSKEFTETELQISLGSQTRFVKHFHYKAWPDFGIPPEPQSLLTFVRCFRAEVPLGRKPITIHCSAGVGRTGAFICLDRITQQINLSIPDNSHFCHLNGDAVDSPLNTLSIDIYGTIKEMRQNRMGMIQNEQQYSFIYQCVETYIRDLLLLNSSKICSNCDVSVDQLEVSNHPNTSSQHLKLRENNSMSLTFSMENARNSVSNSIRSTSTATTQSESSNIVTQITRSLENDDKISENDEIL